MPRRVLCLFLAVFTLMSSSAVSAADPAAADGQETSGIPVIPNLATYLDRFVDNGDSKVVGSALGDYRVTSPSGNAFFAYRFKVAATRDFPLGMGRFGAFSGRHQPLAV